MRFGSGTAALATLTSLAIAAPVAEVIPAEVEGYNVTAPDSHKLAARAHKLAVTAYENENTAGHYISYAGWDHCFDIWPEWKNRMSSARIVGDTDCWFFYDDRCTNREGNYFPALPREYGKDYSINFPAGGNDKVRSLMCKKNRP